MQKKMQAINLTPHVINFYDLDGNLIESIPSSGVARVASKPGTLEDRGLPVPVAAPTEYGAVEGLPDPQDGVVYIVSTLVAQAVKRPDVLSPGTGPSDGAIRDEQGRVAGVTRLIAHV